MHQLSAWHEVLVCMWNTGTLSCSVLQPGWLTAMLCMQVHTMVPNEEGAQLLLLGHRRIRSTGMVGTYLVLRCSCRRVGWGLFVPVCAGQPRRCYQLLAASCLRLHTVVCVEGGCSSPCLLYPVAGCQVNKSPLRVSIQHLKDVKYDPTDVTLKVSAAQAV